MPCEPQKLHRTSSVSSRIHRSVPSSAPSCTHTGFASGSLRITPTAHQSVGTGHCRGTVDCQRGCTCSGRHPVHPPTIGCNTGERWISSSILTTPRFTINFIQFRVLPLQGGETRRPRLFTAVRGLQLF